MECGYVALLAEVNAAKVKFKDFDHPGRRVVPIILFLTGGKHKFERLFRSAANFRFELVEHVLGRYIL